VQFAEQHLLIWKLVDCLDRHEHLTDSERHDGIGRTVSSSRSCFGANFRSWIVVSPMRAAAALH
jgi:hypothetical protein